VSLRPHDKETDSLGARPLTRPEDRSQARAIEEREPSQVEDDALGRGGLEDAVEGVLDTTDGRKVEVADHAQVRIAPRLFDNEAELG